MTLLGIDIGISAIKLSALEGAGEGVRLVAESTAALPPGTVCDGRIENPAAVSRTLGGVLDTLGLRGADAVVALPFCGSTVVLEREAPSAAATGFGDWARATAEDATPFDPMDIVSAAERAPAFGVRFVVARRNHLEAYCESVRKGGARVVGIDSELLALERYHRAAHPDEHGLAVALLDMGVSSPKIAVVQSGRLLLGNVFCCDPEAFLYELPEMVGIRLRTRVGEGVVQRLRLSGGASRIAGLRDALSDHLGIPVGDLGPGLLPFPEDPSTSVSRGMALRLVLPGVELL